MISKQTNKHLTLFRCGGEREREREAAISGEENGQQRQRLQQKQKKKKAIKSAVEERCTFKYQFEQTDWCKAHAQLHYGKHQRKFCLSGSEKAESSQNVRRRHSLLRNNHNLQVTSGNHISGQSAGQLDCSCSGIFFLLFLQACLCETIELSRLLQRVADEGRERCSRCAVKLSSFLFLFSRQSWWPLKPPESTVWTERRQLPHKLIDDRSVFYLIDFCP